MRNAYLLVNYGDFVDGNTTKAPPFVQLLSVTDPASAHLEFVNTRLGGMDTTGFQMAIDLQNSTSNRVPDGASHHQRTNVTLIAGVVSGCVLLLFIAAGAYIAVRRRRGSRLNRGSDFSGVDAGLSSNDYHSLHYPPPPGDDHGRHIGVGRTPMRYLYAETQ